MAQVTIITDAENRFQVIELEHESTIVVIDCATRSFYNIRQYTEAEKTKIYEAADAELFAWLTKEAKQWHR